MPNTFLEGLQRPAILQNNGSGLPDYSEANEGDVLQIQSNEPVWGAVDALPEIEESDEGKVLAVDQGEAVWADAPSGLPEITNADEGKVMAVVEDEQGQPVAGDIIAQGTFTSAEVAGAVIEGATADDFAVGTLINVSVNGNIYWVTMENEEGAPDPVSVAVFGDNDEYQLETDDGDVWFEHPAGTYELIIKTAKYPLSAQWTEPSGGVPSYFDILPLRLHAISAGVFGVLKTEFDAIVDQAPVMFLFQLDGDSPNSATALALCCTFLKDAEVLDIEYATYTTDAGSPQVAITANTYNDALEVYLSVGGATLTLTEDAEHPTYYTGTWTQD